MSTWFTFLGNWYYQYDMLETYWIQMKPIRLADDIILNIIIIYHIREVFVFFLFHSSTGSFVILRIFQWGTC